jgi:hypothetical protein
MAEMRMVKIGVEARTTWWNGTVTSWSEMLLTAMLIVYRTENAARTRDSFCVRRAGTKAPRSSAK